MHVAIIGGSGYTGQELLRLLSLHPHVQIQAVCSRSQVGKPVSETLPFLRGFVELSFSEINMAQLAKMDLVISATPNGVAMHIVPELLDKGVRVIDMAADFRLRDVQLWEKWYGITHACPQVVEQAVYGLSEWNEQAIAHSTLVANPGCYATAMQLALLPFMQKEKQLALANIIVDGKSGISGAGKTPNVDLLFAHIEGNLSAYKIAGHRHVPEVLAQLKNIHPATNITFVPHLIPMTRGMLTTAYIPITDKNFNQETATDILSECYANCPCVDVLPANTSLQTKSVSGTNVCRISATVQGNTLVLCSVIDNLGKGAAGQAIQNLNIMFDYEPTTGLRLVAHYP